MTTAQDVIKSTIENNDVVLFMKGTPVFPQCGFSSVVARVLDHLQVDFESVNVLEDDGIRHIDGRFHRAVTQRTPIDV